MIRYILLAGLVVSVPFLTDRLVDSHLPQEHGYSKAQVKALSLLTSDALADSKRHKSHRMTEQERNQAILKLFSEVE